MNELGFFHVQDNENRRLNLFSVKIETEETGEKTEDLVSPLPLLSPSVPTPVDVGHIAHADNVNA